MAELNFYFAPVCPFAWMSSTWVRQVARLRSYDVEWKFVSLRQLNANVDYDTHFPPEYPAVHDAGLRMLRVAAAARAEHGSAAIGPLYEAFGAHIHDVAKPASLQESNAALASPDRVEEILRDAGLPVALAKALQDESWDAELAAETAEATSLAGKDIGTPVIQVDPPHGMAFFGPVISRRPSDSEAVELWDAVLTLTRFPGFAELKRSLRELPQLRSLGVHEGAPGVVEDWHQGSRKQKR